MNPKFVYQVEIFNKGAGCIYECEAVNENQAKFLASKDNPNWLVRYAKKKVN